MPEHPVHPCLLTPLRVFLDQGNGLDTAKPGQSRRGALTIAIGIRKNVGNRVDHSQLRQSIGPIFDIKR